MSDIKIDELLEKLDLLKQQLITTPCWVFGSVVETTRKQSNKEKPFFYLSQSVKGKTKTTYISAAKLKAFTEAAAHGERLKEILAEINQINILLIKNGQHA